MDNKLQEVLKNEGVLTIVTWNGTNEPNTVATWNSYVRITEEETLLIPVAGMSTAQSNLNENPGNIILMLGSREVEGFNGYQGTGFEIKGTGTILSEGEKFDKMKEEFSFLNKVLEVKISSARQLL